MKWTPKVLEALKQIQFSYVYKSIMLKIVCSSCTVELRRGDEGWRSWSWQLAIHYLVELNFKMFLLFDLCWTFFRHTNIIFSSTHKNLYKNTQLILIAFLSRLLIVFVPLPLLFANNDYTLPPRRYHNH